MPNQGNQNHFLVVTYPAQGHVSPALQFAERVVIHTGAQVTFLCTVFAHRRMINKSMVHPDGLSFLTFSDGYDDGFKPDNPPSNYTSESRRAGTVALSNLIETFANGNRPVTCVIYSIFVPWATEVAHKFQLSSALLWNQSATVFDVYYYYFNGYCDLITDKINDPTYVVHLPGLPPLTAQDIPSFILPTSPHVHALQLFQDEFELLSQETKSFHVLVNTFDEIEPEALKAVHQFNMIGIGPLIPPALIDSSDKQLIDRSKGYVQWLDAEKESSVIYISFGSIAVLTNTQMEELARGLVDSGRPFLWVIRSGEHGSTQEIQDKEEKYTKILREEHRGMIVPWCSQVEVLGHPSLGCFVTHCGWNSTLETLAMGVPVVAFPQWSDQGTTAKLIENIWKVGVRVRPNEDDNKIVKSKEIIRCLEEVMDGKGGEEIRNNVMKLKSSAREAVKPGGSSERNLQTYVEQIGRIQPAPKKTKFRGK